MNVCSECRRRRKFKGYRAKQVTCLLGKVHYVTAGVQRVVDSGERSRKIDVDDLVEILLMLADRIDPPVDPNRRPRVGYDNVEFEEDGHTIVATVIGEDDDVFLLGNPHWDDIWRIPVDRLRLTDRDLNHPPADW